MFQHKYKVIPFSIADDGTLNCAVGSPLSEDEQGIVRRGAGTRVAYFIAADAELKEHLRKHDRFDELEKVLANVYQFIDPSKVNPGAGAA
jgi:adsorption protein B